MREKNVSKTNMINNQDSDSSYDYVVYGSSDCTYCTKAKDLLDRIGVTYRYYDLGKDRQKRSEFLKEMKSKGLLPEWVKTIPVIFKNGVYIGGFRQLSAEAELEPDLDLVSEF